jgi:hypothetical protein
MPHISKLFAAGAYMCWLSLSRRIPTLNSPPPSITATPLPAPPPSVMQLPLTVPMDRLWQAAEADIPTSSGAGKYNFSINGGADRPNGISLGYDVHRAPVQISSFGNQVVTAMDFDYWHGADASLMPPGL